MNAPATRWTREGPLLVGALVVLVAGTAAAQQRQIPPQIPLDVLGYALLAAVVLATAARRHRPRTVFVVVVALVAVYLMVGYAYGPIFLAAAVAAFAFACAVRGPVAVGGVAAATLLWLLVELPGIAESSRWASLLPLAAGFTGCLMVPVWLAAMRARARDAAAAAAERLRRERSEQRLELAREVHDVVAHNLTVIGVQAGAALTVLDRNPGHARECLSSIIATNRQALTELRATIDLLRGFTDPGDRAPAAAETALPNGTAGIVALVESARLTGARVGYSVTGLPRPTVDGVERAAHRIVQESLTNAMRHAPGAGAVVELEYDDAFLRVRVLDDGPGTDGHPEGRGITGMRERAASVGGRLVVESGANGGTKVLADLPLNGRLP